MTDLFVIDISAFAGNSSQAKQLLAQQVDRACRETGFLAITGHGVPAKNISSIRRVVTDFFDLPLEEKIKVAMPNPNAPYGYAPFAGEVLAQSLGINTPPDLKESFSAGPLSPRPSHTLSFASEQERVFRTAENLWPARPEGFTKIWSSYYRKMERLASTIMKIFAMALGLPEDFFDDRIDKHISAMRALNYPGLTESLIPGQLRAGPHTDYGSLTILLPQAGAGGLELCTPDGRWQEVPEVAGGFIVNIGDLLARWTNDRWVSTLHRVVCPSQGAQRRQSIAFFQQPNWDAEVSCLPTCLAPGEQAKYPPVKSGPHLMEKFHRAFAPTQRSSN
jgi:isopenicillin N synthase-like dioxygenase